MAKKVRKNICGEIQDYSTVGKVYTDLIEYPFDQEIFVVLPDGTKHKIEYINSVSHNGEPLKCEIYIKKPDWAKF